jgi:hypothetical protein
MKTFEEALSSQVKQTTPAGLEETQKEFADTLGRYRCLAEEAGDSPTIGMFAIIWTRMAEAESVEVACFSAFMTGLITGIEMEKAE